jgi:D-inositol-3-phosphate glycosyltransferase
VGRIQPLKGLDVAVCARAALQQTDALLVAVGGPSGPAGDVELARVHRLAEELGVEDRIRYVPPQPHHLLSTYYRAADLCVVPSRSESFGLVALEAAACGTPVVAAAVGGLATIVEDGTTGVLIEGRDPIAFAAAISDLLGNRPRARAMGEAAAARARGYTWSTAAARLRRVYTDLTQRQLVDCA